MMKVYRESPIPEAKKEALEFLELAKQENDPYYLVKTYYLLGYLCAHSDDIGNAIIYYLEGARYAEKSNNPELKENLISIYKNLGSILGDYHHYELSHKFINQGLKIASNLGDQDQIKSLLNNRIGILIKNELYKEAIHQIDSFNSLFKIKGIELIKMKNQEGVVYKNTGQNSRAITVFEFILQNGREISPLIYASSLQNLGNIYFESGKYEKALELYKRQIAITRTEKFNQLLFQSLELAGKTYLEQGDYQNAIAHLKEAVLLDETSDLEPETYTAYEILSKAYEKSGDMKQAFYYQNISGQKLKEFLADQQKIAELNKKYNIQMLAEKYFELLASQKGQRQADWQTQMALAGCTLLFILILFLIYIYKPYKKSVI